MNTGKSDSEEFFNALDGRFVTTVDRRTLMTFDACGGDHPGLDVRIAPFVLQDKVIRGALIRDARMVFDHIERLASNAK